ncbi:carboxypeptidase-like regulatory domain-containing protein, partial [Bradyrhizobium elkanii]
MSVYKYDPSTNAFVLVDDSALLGTDLANFSVATDLPDYAPGSTAYFTAKIGIGDTVTFNVSDTLGKDVSGTSQPWTVTDGGAGDLDGIANGVIQTTWAVGQDAAGESFVLSAMDQTAGLLATTTFTDAGNGNTPVVQFATPNANPAALTLTTAGSQGNVGDAIFQEVTGSGTGSGSVTAFVRINGAPNDTDGSSTTEEGFNTDYRTPPKAPLDDIDNLTFTHSLSLSDVPIVTVGGIQYREFRLDLGEAGNGDNAQAYISLDSLQIYVGGASLATVSSVDRPLQQDGTASTGVTGGTLVYDLDAGADRWIALKDLNAGNGQTNYRVLIPDSDFTAAGANATSKVLLYSAFGYQGTVDGISYVQDSTFEEWSVAKINAGTATISGSKLVDADGSLQTTGDQTHLAGWTIYIDGNDNNQLDVGEVSTTTDANGNFSFTGLAAGTYTIREVLLSGWSQLSPLSPDEFTVTVAAGGTQSGINFINFQDFSISGTKYEDLTGNGTSADDTPWSYGPVTIYIDDDNSHGLSAGDRTTTTDANGHWSISGLTLADVGKSIYEVVPGGSEQTGTLVQTIDNPGSGGTDTG